MKKRFLSKVKKTKGCWLWTAGQRSKGYGAFKVDGKVKLAHRVSYELFVSPIPDGMVVCHKCDNPTCVRPDHLFLGTQRDNMIDAYQKGRVTMPTGVSSSRFLPGDKHRLAKLNKQKVVTIRKRYANGWSLRRLAKKYDVDHKTISKIVKRITWQNV